MTGKIFARNRRATRSGRGLKPSSFAMTSIAVGIVSLALVQAAPAQAAQARVGLGSAAAFAVLAHTTVTNTGPTTISGSTGVSPGTAVTGFPPGKVRNGSIHRADAVAAQAQQSTTTAYNDAAGRSVTASVGSDVGGRTLSPGVYRSPTLGITGTLTLNAHGNPSAVFIFQAGSTLITASSSRVKLINGATACNVFWQVGSSATLGTNSTFVGTVLALTSISAQTGASLRGRLLARGGAVTLDRNTIVRPACTTATGRTTGNQTTTTGKAGSTTGKAGSTAQGGRATTLPVTGARVQGLALAGLAAVIAGTLLLLSPYTAGPASTRRRRRFPQAKHLR